MEVHISKGFGVKSRFGEHLWLDIRLLGEHHINTKLREVKEICQHFLGIDPVKELIPVRPAQHYSMGGVRTDHHGQSPKLAGLFAAGEAACWDIHGFNRLGGNSVAETVVAGMIIGETMADFIRSPQGHIEVSSALIERFMSEQQQLIDGFANPANSENPFAITRQMQQLMSTNVAIFRELQPLQQTLDELLALQQQAQNIFVKATGPGANPALVAAYRVQRMIKLALCVTLGALQRTESRGAHYRNDFPLRNDQQWLCRTLATWANTSDNLPTLTYQQLDINKMALLPGWRGYGSKERIDHPLTLERLNQVGDQLLPDQLIPMDFESLLPKGLRGPNARLDKEHSHE
jgi:fumarate reductase flavoprotein subunit